MTPASLSERVLQAWEHGVGRPLPEQAKLALECLAPDEPAPAALHARDAALLRARIALRGPALDAVVACPCCGEEFDLSVDLAAFDAPGAAAAEVTVLVDGWTARVRPPEAADLAGLDAMPPEDFALALFHRCVEAAERHGKEVSPDALPRAVRAAAAEALAGQGMEGPAADLACGACAHAWRAPLDIARVLLGDIDAWARRDLDEVHRIASAYHWSERDILALSPARRRFYLEILG